MFFAIALIDDDVAQLQWRAILDDQEHLVIAGGKVECQAAPH
jgi:hypothetical protein